MKTAILTGKLLLFALIVVTLCVPAFAAPLKAVPGQFIVLMDEAKVPPAIKGLTPSADRAAKVKMLKLRSSQVESKISAHLTKNSIAQNKLSHVFSNVISGYSAKLSQAEVTKLKGDPDVSGVFQDYEVNLDPMPVSTVAPTDYTSGGSYFTCAVKMAGGPVNSTGKATWIWILDTGINGTHPDLAVRADYAASFIAGQTWEDGHGHGTHCAGIAAAKMNNIGPTGVSAGAWVVPVKVLSNTGGGTFSSMLAGLNYVAQRDIPGDVVSMSIGTDPINNCPAYALPINHAIYNLTVAGTWVVMAAGNNGLCGGAAKSSPGCIYADYRWTGSSNQWVQMPRAVTVGAVDCNLVRASYSNWGPRPPMDYVAVGSNVWSTYKNQGYATMSGTSMATPVVAGIIHARGGAPLNGPGVTACNLPVPLAKRQ